MNIKTIVELDVEVGTYVRIIDFEATEDKMSTNKWTLEDKKKIIGLKAQVKYFNESANEVTFKLVRPTKVHTLRSYSLDHITLLNPTVEILPDGRLEELRQFFSSSKQARVREADDSTVYKYYVEIDDEYWMNFNDYYALLSLCRSLNLEFELGLYDRRINFWETEKS